MSAGVRALSFDLDDTLWPIAPAIARAEAALHAWFVDHAPAVAHRYDVRALRELRDRVARDHPQRAHDFSWVRHHSLALALQECGHDAALADAAFDAFFRVRNQLALYEEVEAVLAELSARFPLVALTNGNADLALAGVAPYFRDVVSARSFGTPKPAAAIFHEACLRLGFAPPEVLHVGDDWQLDVLGARAAGLQAAWLCRDAAAPLPGEGDPGIWRIADLGELRDRLAVTK